jgi:pimeloyl-ACP methyl ester carboxylesterase
VIDPLADPAAFGGDPADAFDVIVPSLPGFGFPGPLTGFPDVNFWKVADVWHILMTETLGYEKYAAGGCDIGAIISQPARPQVRRRACGGAAGMLAAVFRDDRVSQSEPWVRRTPRRQVVRPGKSKRGGRGGRPVAHQLLSASSDARIGRRLK